MDKIKAVKTLLSLLFFTIIVEGNMFDLRDINFDSNYNKYELPPSHDGKPLLVSEILQLSIFKLFINYGPTQKCEIMGPSKFNDYKIWFL